MPEIITRAEAKAQGLKRYFTGEPCKRGHVAERLTYSHACYECVKARDALRNAKPEKKARKAFRNAKRYSTPEGRAADRAYKAKRNATPEGRAAVAAASNKSNTKKLCSKLTDADAELKTWLDLDAKDQAERARKKVQKYRDLLTARLLKWEGQEAVDAQLAAWAAADAVDEAAREAAAAEAEADDNHARQERGEIPHRAGVPG